MRFLIENHIETLKRPLPFFAHNKNDIEEIYMFAKIVNGEYRGVIICSDNINQIGQQITFHDGLVIPPSGTKFKLKN